MYLSGREVWEEWRRGRRTFLLGFTLCESFFALFADLGEAGEVGLGLVCLALLVELCGEEESFGYSQ